MAKIFRRLVIGAISLIALTGIALVIFAYTFDLNAHKPDIEKIVHDATGRTLAIKGDLSISVWPTIGVKIGETILGNPVGFDRPYFAKVDAVVVGVALMPLLSKKVQVSSVLIDGAEVVLVQLSEGKNNWADLAGEDTAAAETAKPNAQSSGAKSEWLQNLNVESVRLRDASFTFDDRVAQQSTVINKINLSTGTIDLDSPIDIEGGLHFKNSAPALDIGLTFSSRVRADLDSMVMGLADTMLSVNGNSSAFAIDAIDLNLRTSANLNIGKQLYEVSALDLNVKLKTPALPNRLNATLVASPSIDLAAGKIAVNSATLGINDAKFVLESRITHLNSTPDVEFSAKSDVEDFRKWLATLGVELPPTADNKVMNRLALLIKGQFSNNKLNLKMLNLNLDDTAIKGKAQVAMNEMPMKATLDLHVDDINVDRYMAPTTDAPEVVEEESAETDMFGWMDMLHFSGNASVGKLIVTKIEVTDIKVGINSDSAKIVIDPIDARVWGGQQAGQLVVHRGNPPKIELQESLSIESLNIMLEQLLGKSFLDGKGSIQMKGSLVGLEPKQILSSLNLDGAMALKNGTLPRINLSQEIRKAKAKFTGSSFTEQASGQTQFSDIASNFSVQNGVLKMKDMNFASDNYSASGKWDYNLAGDEIDADLNVVFPKSALESLGPDLKELAGISIPLRITGSSLSPKISVDLKQVMQNVAKNALNKEKAKVAAKVQVKKEEIKKKADEAVDKSKEKATEKINEELKKIDLKKLFR